MLRSSLIFAAFAIAAPAAAQSVPLGATPSSNDCLVRADASPASWIIQGYDPFGGSTPEGTFAVTFRNEGTGDCIFTPTFQLDHPPFGLSKGTGKPIAYALLDVTNSQDVTPRAGRSQRTPSQPQLDLKANQSRTLIYKLVANPDDVRDAGAFTQQVDLEAQDSSFRSFGGTRLLLGLNVLPSARIGLTGAFTMQHGHAVVDLGELRQGLAPVPLRLRVSSTGRYDIAVSSANSGRLRLGASEWYVPYTLAIGPNALKLEGASTVSSANDDGFRRDSLPIQFIIGDVSNRLAGVYSDVVSISVTAR
jgi:hypothetical protein